jgi:hypothetical protein
VFAIAKKDAPALKTTCFYEHIYTGTMDFSYRTNSLRILFTGLVRSFLPSDNTCRKPPLTCIVLQGFSFFLNCGLIVGTVKIRRYLIPYPGVVQGRLEDHEPQDLTPMQDVGQMSGGMSSSPDTPGKKDRNSRKQCPYCTKGQPDSS